MHIVRHCVVFSRHRQSPTDLKNRLSFPHGTIVEPGVFYPGGGGTSTSHFPLDLIIASASPRPRVRTEFLDSRIRGNDKRCMILLRGFVSPREDFVFIGVYPRSSAVSESGSPERLISVSRRLFAGYAWVENPPYIFTGFAVDGVSLRFLARTGFFFGGFSCGFGSSGSTQWA